MTRLLCEVGRAGAVRSVLEGGDVDPGTGRLLSVAELQAALRAARLAAVTRTGNPSSVDLSTAHRSPGDRSSPTDAPHDVARHLPNAAAGPTGDLPGAGSPVLKGPAWLVGPRPTGGGPWLAVLGAHPQAGASTAALALAEALAEAGRRVHLVSCQEPSRCGLRGAPTRELGVDASGAWSTGTRGPSITIFRPLSCPDVDTSWPHVAVADQGTAEPAGAETFTVVDVELGAPAASLSSAAAVVIVCRAGAVNLACAEQLLELFGGAARPVLLIVSGSGRRPGAAERHAGPLTRRSMSDGRLLRMPTDRQLDRFGLSGRPLPAPVRRTGATAIALIAGPSRTSRLGRNRPLRSLLPTEQPASGSLLTPKDF